MWKLASRRGESSKIKGWEGRKWYQTILKLGARFNAEIVWFFNDFLMDFWIDFRVIFDVIWDEKSRDFFDRFLDVLFLRLGSAARLRRDFNRGAYGQDAPQAAPLNKKRDIITTP